MNRREQELVIREKQLVSKRSTEAVILAVMDYFYGLGYRKKRINRILNGITEKAEIMASGMIGFEDYKTSVEEKTKITLEEE